MRERVASRADHIISIDRREYPRFRVLKYEQICVTRLSRQTCFTIFYTIHCRNLRVLMNLVLLYGKNKQKRFYALTVGRRRILYHKRQKINVDIVSKQKCQHALL